MTVLEAIQRGSEFLAGKGVESPRLQAELLLAHVLQLPRLRLYLQFDRSLKTEEIERSRELLKRRGRREPLQHLVGTVSFCGLELKVGPQALIPRPETELLAEKIWLWLRASGLTSPTVLDFGTGTGCLILALASQCPGLLGHALDVSPDALALARENAARHHLLDRVQFHLGEGFSALPLPLRFDVVVSNPPYIPSAEIDHLAPEVRDYDPRLALDGGADGLACYRRLAAETGARLRPGGTLWLEIGDGQATAVTALLEHHKWIVEGVELDYSARPRIVRARWSG